MANDVSNDSTCVGNWTLTDSNMIDSQYNFFEMDHAPHTISRPTDTPSVSGSAPDGGTTCFEGVNTALGTASYLFLWDAKLNELMPGSSAGVGWTHQSCSFCGWFKLDSVDPNTQGFYYFMTLSNKWEVKYRISGGNGYMRFTVGSTHLDHASALSTATWYFFVATYNSDRTMRLKLYNESGEVGSAVSGTAGADLSNAFDNLRFCSATQAAESCVDGRTYGFKIFSGKDLYESGQGDWADADDLHSGDYPTADTSTTTTSTTSTTTTTTDEPSSISVTGGTFRINADGRKLDRYGLRFPVTYLFRIDTGLSGCKVYHRHTDYSAWVQLKERTAAQYFNKRECVRWDYTNGRAYVSVSFGNTTSDIFLKLTDASDNILDCNYLGTCKYYDNRRAAVNVNTHDWQDASDGRVDKYITELENRNFNHTFLMATKSGQIQYDDVNTYLATGNMDIVAHSRTHTTSINYNNATLMSEVVGNRDDIINNCGANFPWYMKRNGVAKLPIFWWPGDQWNDSVETDRAQERVAKSGFLAQGGCPAGHSNSCVGFCNAANAIVQWNKDYGSYGGLGNFLNTVAMDDNNPTLDYYCGRSLAACNAKFDDVMDRGGFYSAYFHPDSYTIETLPDDDWQFDHLDYIDGDKTLWYCGYSMIALYRYTIDHAGLVVTKIDNYESPLTVTENFDANESLYSEPQIFGKNDGTITFTGGRCHLTPGTERNDGVGIKTTNSNLIRFKANLKATDPDNPYLTMAIGTGAIWGRNNIEYPDYRWTYFSFGYHIEIDADEVRLVRDDNSTYDDFHEVTELASWNNSGNGPDPGNFHEYEIKLSGTGITVERDSVQILSDSDTTYSSGYGYIGAGKH